MKKERDGAEKGCLFERAEMKQIHMLTTADFSGSRNIAEWLGFVTGS